MINEVIFGTNDNDLLGDAEKSALKFNQEIISNSNKEAGFNAGATQPKVSKLDTRKQQLIT